MNYLNKNKSIKFYMPKAKKLNLKPSTTRRIDPKFVCEALGAEEMSKINGGFVAWKYQIKLNDHKDLIEEVMTGKQYTFNKVGEAFGVLGYLWKWYAKYHPSDPNVIKAMKKHTDIGAYMDNDPYYRFFHVGKSIAESRMSCPACMYQEWAWVEYKL